MAQERSEQAVVLVAPIAPAPGGNGLAMRAGMFLDALAAVCAVDLVVVPIAGPAATTTWAETRARRIAVVEPVDRAGAREHGIAQLADPWLRARLEVTAPVPDRAASVPPTLAAAVARELDPSDQPPTAVLTLREYLVPFGLTLAQRLGAARAVVDLDDDVEQLYAQQLDTDSAQAYRRLHRAWLGDAAAVCLASPVDAARVAARYERDDVVTVPNALAPAARVRPTPGNERVLFVGNLTYEPNIDAARFLVTEIWPRIVEQRPRATLELVGRHDARLQDLADVPGVRLAGFVDDLSHAYAAADVVVAPLRAGSGTRIKVLEAWAHGRPLVATTTAVEGLAVRPAVDALVADTAGELAGAIVRLLDDPELGERLVRAGSETLHDRYTPDAVAPLIRSVVLGDREDPREAGER